MPDYGAFINSANGGKGGGYVEVSQRVPVQGGHKYTLRFHLRTLDFPGGENKDPGPGRGLCLAEDRSGLGRRAGGVWVVNHQDTTPDWITLTDAEFNYYGPAIPYTAPPGATSAIIRVWPDLQRRAASAEGLRGRRGVRRGPVGDRHGPF